MLTEPMEPPLELKICTFTFAIGADVPASVTVPEIAPPCASAKFIPEVVVPAVTATGVPVVTVQPATQAMLSYNSLMYPNELLVRRK